MTADKRDREIVAEIVRDAGGQIVGRTKLQKIAYLLELTGQGSGFEFEYRHYGPYSESLSSAVRIANVFGLVREEERVAKWGGHYSVFSTIVNGECKLDQGRSRFVSKAAEIGSVELELAATAAYLAVVENCPEPWKETSRRKPEKAADGRLAKAMEAYRKLMSEKVPKPLPSIV